MAYRLPTSIPRDLPELWERFREYVRQTEPVVIENRRIATTETAVAHGLKETPGWVGWDPPHCIAIVKQTRPPDHQNVYLKATVECVVNVYVVRAGPLGRGEVINGGFEWPDWVPASDDHKVLARNADATTVGGLSEKTKAGAGVTLSVVTDGGVEKLQIARAASPYSTETVIESFTVPGGGLASHSIAFASADYDWLDLYFSQVFKQGADVYLKADGAEGKSTTWEHAHQADSDGSLFSSVAEFPSQARAVLSQLDAQRYINHTAAIGTAPTLLAIWGDYALVGFYSTSKVIAYSLAPLRTGGVPVATGTGASTTGKPMCFAVWGDFLISCNEDGSLDAFDLTGISGADPSLVSTANMPGGGVPVAALLCGDYLAIFDYGRSKIQTWSLAPILTANPMTSSSAEVAGYAFRVACKWGTNYAIDTQYSNGTAHTWDISACYSGGQASQLTGTENTLLTPYEMLTHGDFLILNDNGSNTLRTYELAIAGGVVSYTLIGDISLDTRGLVASGNRLIVGNNTVGCFLDIYDLDPLDNAAVPTLVSRDPDSFQPFKLAMWGGYAISISNADEYVQGSDVSTPDSGHVHLWKLPDNTLAFEATLTTPTGRLARRVSGSLPAWTTSLDVVASDPGNAGLVAAGTIVTLGKWL